MSDERGFSVLELVIASALGVLVLAMAIELWTTARQTERLEQAHSQVNQTARVALTVLRRAIHQAGFAGCHPRYRRHLLDPAPTPADPAISDPRALQRTRQGDALAIHRWRSIASAQVELPPQSSMNSAAIEARIALSQPHNLAPGQPVVLASRNGTNCVLFEQAGRDAEVLDRRAGSAVAPGNTQPDEGYRAFAGGVEMFVPERTIFSVDESVAVAGLNSLYRQRQSDGDRRQELIVGVHDLQVRYAVDDNGDGAADRLTAAAGVGQWARIRGVEIALWINNGRRNPILRTPMQLGKGGASAPDRRLYRRFTTFVALTNWRL